MKYKVKTNINRILTIVISVAALLVVINFIGRISALNKLTGEVNHQTLCVQNEQILRHLADILEIDHFKQKEDLSRISELTTKYYNNLNSLQNGGLLKYSSKGIEVKASDKDVLPQLALLSGEWSRFNDLLHNALKIEKEENQAITNLNNIIPQLQVVENYQLSLSRIIDRERNKTHTKIIWSLIIISLLNSLYVFGIYFLIKSFLTTPIKQLSNVVNSFAQGNLTVNIPHKGNNEIGQIARNLETLKFNIEDAALFAQNIGEGQFDKEYKIKGDNDKLGIALSKMQEQLLDVNERDNRENWITEGLAKFAELLRDNRDNLAQLSETIIGCLVNYTGANQGAIFILNDEDPDMLHMEMTGCYAWKKKKHLEKKIYKGEDLVGQSWQEGATIYLTDVPDNYVSITSGLGKANPKSIIIEPLKVDDEVLGIIELAGFHPFEEYKRKLISSLAESIASSISAVKINVKTKALLEISQKQTEELRAQEEELRQNMEEIQATQEELSRKESESTAIFQAISSSALLAEFGIDGDIITMNDKFRAILDVPENQIENQKYYELVGHDNDEFQEICDKLRHGTSVNIETQCNRNGMSMWLKQAISPVYDVNKNPFKFLVIALDITDLMDRKQSDLAKTNGVKLL